MKTATARALSRISEYSDHDEWVRNPDHPDIVLKCSQCDGYKIRIRHFIEGGEGPGYYCHSKVAARTVGTFLFKYVFLSEEFKEANDSVRKGEVLCQSCL